MSREGAGGAGRLGRRSRLLGAVTAALASVLLLAPASNADVPVEPTLAYPINSANAEVVVQINAGPKTWHIKQAARKMDAVIDGLTIRTSGDCSAADACVNVYVDHYDPPEMLALSYGQVPDWMGLTEFRAGNERVIYLNTYVMNNRQHRLHSAAHEFGHILGLEHHTAPGLMSVTPDQGTLELSADELALLQGWYAAN